MTALTTSAIHNARRQRGSTGGAALAGVSVEQLEWQAQAMMGVFQASVQGMPSLKTLKPLEGQV
jgi:hypothetical protein